MNHTFVYKTDSRSWKQVVHFKPDPSDPAGAPVAISPNTAPVEEAPVGFIAPVMSDDMVIVRDERGVRLAREVDD